MPLASTRALAPVVLPSTAELLAPAGVGAEGWAAAGPAWMAAGRP
jgi:hypothetical protein